jgi:hypothetical protein
MRSLSATTPRAPTLQGTTTSLQAVRKHSKAQKKGREAPGDKVIVSVTL